MDAKSESALAEALNEILKFMPHEDEKEQLDEDADVHDMTGGNIDDAYSMGFEHGAVATSREICRIAKEALAKLG